MKITVIGSTVDPNSPEAASGGLIKVALFERVLKKGGFEVELINLISWKKRFLRTVFKIRKAVKRGDTVLIMAGPVGSRLIIKLCVFFNKTNRARLIFPMLGTGVIDGVSNKLSIEDASDLLNNKNTFGINDEKMGKTLAKLDLILAQNEIVVDFYKKFYKLNNVEKINNFRLLNSRPAVNKVFNKDKKFVFFARICPEKGIFDLLEAVEQINKSGIKCVLDIYGKLQLNREETSRFESSLNENVKYKGAVKNDEALKTINNYDFLVFPTKAHGEGTPGTIIESFLSGVPVLSSNFPNAKSIITDGKEGILFNLNSVESLKSKLLSIIAMGDQELEKFKIEAYNAGNVYDYDYYRETFLGFITKK